MASSLGIENKVAYKKDQGRYARMASFWTLLFIVLAGLYKFKYWLDTWGGWMKVSVTGGSIPLIKAEPLSLSVIVSWVALPLLSAYLLHRLLNKPKTADMLIETEAELKKCTWPTLQETWSASIVVVVTVLITMGFLAFSDVVLKKIFDIIVFSGGG